MDFSRRKLPKEAAEKMRICPVNTVRPFALMPAPVYAFMKLNEKFVSVKAPLDFFTSAELDRLKSFEFFYLPSFVDSASRFRTAARTILGLLSWKPETVEPGAESSSSSKDVAILTPASYELADAVLHQVGPLWGPSGSIEPFFAAVLVNDLCEPFSEEQITHVRDRSVDAFEEGVMISSWAVFLALHLGYCDLIFLNSLRSTVFDTVGNGLPLSSDYTLMDELLVAARSTLQGGSKRAVQGLTFSMGKQRIQQKLASRFKRIEEQFLKPTAPAATIYGEGGFVDV